VAKAAMRPVTPGDGESLQAGAISRPVTPADPSAAKEVRRPVTPGVPLEDKTANRPEASSAVAVARVGKKLELVIRTKKSSKDASTHQKAVQHVEGTTAAPTSGESAELDRQQQQPAMGQQDKINRYKYDNDNSCRRDCRVGLGRKHFFDLSRKRKLLRKVPQFSRNFVNFSQKVFAKSSI
jgi:hypothetical protein